MMNNNTNMNFERRGSLKDGFTWILNQTLNDKKLSSCPEAVLVYLKISQFENSPTHKISIRGIATQTGVSVGKISKGFNKLIEVGYVKRVPIYNGNLINGYKYFIYDILEENEDFIVNSTNENSSKKLSKNNDETVENSRGIENKETENRETENSNIKKKIEKKENKKKENKGVGDDTSIEETQFIPSKTKEQLVKENMIIELYKTYKIQSKVMPQMKKVLLTYADKIDLELYEEIFMLASEDNVKSKYNYIKDLLIKFDTKGIYTLKDYQLDCENFKKSKQVSNSKNKSKGSKGQNSGSNDKHKVHTRFHNVNSRLTDMSKDYLEETVAMNQYLKFNNKTDIRKVYIKAMNLGLSSLSSDDIRETIIEFAQNEGLEVPK